MIRHNFILTYRNFKRYKSSFFINLIGLSTGLACTFLIYLWVSDELNVDQFNDKDSRLYRAMEHRVRAENGIWTSPTTPGPLAEALASDMPEVEYAITATWPQPYTLSLNDKNVTALGRFAGKDFFNMFSYELIAGDANQVLTDKNAVVISDVLARKLFNTTENLIGKAIDYQGASGPCDFDARGDVVAQLARFRVQGQFVDVEKFDCVADRECPPVRQMGSK